MRPAVLGSRAPVRLLPTIVAKTLALVAMAAAGPLLIAALTPLVAPARRHRWMLLATIVLLPTCTVLSVRRRYLDDFLAMTFAILALRSVSADPPI